MGHSDPSVTLKAYSHLFDARDHAAKMAAMLQTGFGNDSETAMRGEARSVAVASIGADPISQAAAG